MSKAAKWVFLSGLLWFVAGFYLLSKGITLLVYSLTQDSTPFLALFSSLTSSQETMVILSISLALLLGYIKGRFVLLKTVKSVVKRILSLTDPIRVRDLYSKGYLFLLLGMVFLGLAVRFFPMTQDVKGFIDLTIGSALMNGALLYFRFAFVCKKVEKIN